MRAGPFYRSLKAIGDQPSKPASRSRATLRLNSAASRSRFSCSVSPSLWAMSAARSRASASRLAAPEVGPNMLLSLIWRPLLLVIDGETITYVMVHRIAGTTFMRFGIALTTKPVQPVTASAPNAAPVIGHFAAAFADLGVYSRHSAALSFNLEMWRRQVRAIRFR